MAHHFFDNKNMDWIVGLTNCLLIREPKAVIGSFKKSFLLIQFYNWVTLSS